MTDFERNLRDQLRASELRIVEEDLHRLCQGRQRALAANRGFRLPRFLLPLGGMTLASLAIFLLVLSPQPQTTNTAVDTMAQDAAEMQDLDFYYWLAETQDVSEI